VERSILAPSTISRKVIFNGVDLKLFCPGDLEEARKKLKLPIDADILLFASHGIKENRARNYNMLEQAIRFLSQDYKSRPLILICLGGRYKKKKIKNSVILFVDFQMDPKVVADYYRAADLYLHPAIEETFSTVIAEALACGKPVVATRAGGIPELVTDGQNGFLVSREDTKMLTNRIKQLLNDKPLRRGFGENARLVAGQKFGLNQQIKSYLDYYEQILEEDKNIKRVSYIR